MSVWECMYEWVNECILWVVTKALHKSSPFSIYTPHPPTINDKTNWMITDLILPKTQANNILVLEIVLLILPMLNSYVELWQIVPSCEVLKSPYWLMYTAQTTGTKPRLLVWTQRECVFIRFQMLPRCTDPQVFCFLHLRDTMVRELKAFLLIDPTRAK